jgi:hypothetical protein
MSVHVATFDIANGTIHALSIFKVESAITELKRRRNTSANFQRMR